MSSYDGKDLFGSGRHTIEIGGLSLRHALAAVPGGRGVRLSSQGHGGRSIKVYGELRGDDLEQVRQLWLAIEQCLDGTAGVLVDNDGHGWDQVVMLGFEPGAVTRIGARWRCRYEVSFVQVLP